MKKSSALKLSICSLVLCLAMNTFAQDQNFHIYLCFGQSNMAGAGKIAKQDSTVDSRFQVMYPMIGCTIFNRTFGTWSPAIPPLWGCPSGGLGPSDYFGRTMVQNLPATVRVGVIVIGVPGCDIRLFDKKGFQTFDTYNYVPKKYNGSAYAWLMELAKLAQKDGVIKGFIMHQGETMPDAAKWPGWVKAVYDSLIVDLSLTPAKTPLLAGEMLYTGACAGNNKTVALLPSVIPNAHVISAKDLTGQDQFHFTAEAQRIFGARYAQKMLALQPTAVIETKQPASERTIRHSINQNGTMRIMLKEHSRYAVSDLSGRILEIGSGLGAVTVCRDLPSGLYFLSVKSKQGHFTERIVK